MSRKLKSSSRVFLFFLCQNTESMIEGNQNASAGAPCLLPYINMKLGIQYIHTPSLPYALLTMHYHSSIVAMHNYYAEVTRIC
jgi:hypothetical protein